MDAVAAKVVAQSRLALRIDQSVRSIFHSIGATLNMLLRVPYTLDIAHLFNQ